jgi:hypothetical protein
LPEYNQLGRALKGLSYFFGKMVRFDKKGTKQVKHLHAKHHDATCASR